MSRSSRYTTRRTAASDAMNTKISRRVTGDMRHNAAAMKGSSGPIQLRNTTSNHARPRGGFSSPDDAATLISAARKTTTKSRDGITKYDTVTARTRDAPHLSLCLCTVSTTGSLSATTGASHVTRGCCCSSTLPSFICTVRRCRCFIQLCSASALLPFSTTTRGSLLLEMEISLEREIVCVCGGGGEDEARIRT